MYGGNIIANLVSMRSNLTKNEKLGGRLKIQFDQLKGAINLDSGVKVAVKDSFSNMEDKFDVVVCACVRQWTGMIVYPCILGP